MYGLREDAATLIESLREVADVLSKHGYTHIADVFARDGLQKALDVIDAARENAPGEKPRLYRTGTRPYSHKGYITVRDRYVALGLIESAPEGLSLDLYSPDPIAWIGHQNVRLVLENIESVMKFLRRYRVFLSNLPSNAAENAILRFARGEDASNILKRYILTCLKEGLRSVVSSTWLEGVERLCDLTVIDSSPHVGTRLRAVDLDGLKVSKAYKPGEMANLLLKNRRNVKWEGDLIEVLGETEPGRRALRRLARLKPELAVLLPP